MARSGDGNRPPGRVTHPRGTVTESFWGQTPELADPGSDPRT